MGYVELPAWFGTVMHVHQRTSMAHSGGSDDDPSQSLSTDFFVPRSGQSAYPYRIPNPGRAGPAGSA